MIEDVANSIIEYCNDENIEITNLKLQKLLYFYQKEYYIQNKKLAFSDEFMAFRYGPVNYDMWKKYQDKLYVEKRTKVDVKKYLSKYIRRSNTSLVNLSHVSKEWQDKSKQYFSTMSYENLKEEWDV